IRKKENIKELLSDVGVRERVKKEMLEDKGEWENFLLSCGAEKIIISSVNSEKNREIEGKNLKEISEMRRKDVVECILDIVADEDGMAGIIIFSMNESNVKKLIKHKKGFIGTDGLPGKHPHPRLWGTFPRILRKYVREEKLISLKDALYKFTKGPAEKLGLKKRGEIREGYFADIVIFAPDRVKDNASFSNPEVKPDGILYVIVNGEVVISNGEFTGKTPGKVLLKT
ncbi:MAG: aminoacylase, partial [Candidatus Omnitrophota bacterium]